jgi:hypothetical protein
MQYLAIQPLNRADTHAAAVIAAKGMASTHLVDLSIIVNRWVFPEAEQGKGTTRSI